MGGGRGRRSFRWRRGGCRLSNRHGRSGMAAGLEMENVNSGKCRLINISRR